MAPRSSGRSKALEAAELANFEALSKKNLAEAAYFEEQRRGEILENSRTAIDLEKEKIEWEFERQANVLNRTYDFVGGVSTLAVEMAVQHLTRWERMSKDPIVLRFTSPGGSVIDGMTLYDHILGMRERGIHITVIAKGWAASMAGILLQSGTRRVIAPNAWLLIHEISAATGGTLGQLKDDIKWYERMNEQGLDILADRAKISKKKIAALMNRKDCWLSSKEALEYGFVDEVGHS